MILGVLTVDLSIPGARSLKDKRRAVAGLKDRLRARFNVSVAEVDYLDAPQRCLLGLAVVCRESRVAHSQLDKMVDVVRQARGLTLVEYHREML